MTRAADTTSPHADPATRLAARLLDLAIGVAPLVVLLPFGLVLGSRTLIHWSFALTFAVGLVILPIDLVLLHRDGQTIGKRLLGLRIVGVDGERVGLGRSFFVREVVMGLLGAAPWLGIVVSIVDPLLCLRADRRCLHDRLAATIVIDVRRPPG